MSERREGWYWAKYAKGDEWQCAYYDPWSDAFLFAEWGAISSHSVKQVGPRIPTPDEDWQCVPKEPTEEMTRLFNERLEMRYHPNSPYRCKHTWGGMLSAAPNP